MMKSCPFPRVDSLSTRAGRGGWKVGEDRLPPRTGDASLHQHAHPPSDWSAASI
jgi:hypothetical protein